jgi:hypothetical protein
MKKPSDYFAKLKDPRWQRKRLEILERDGWQCNRCGETATALNVHHRYYLKNRDPWDYEDDSLVSLCDPCHKNAEVLRQELIKTVGVLHDAMAEQAIGYMQAQRVIDSDTPMSIALVSHEQVEGIADFLHTDDQVVFAAAGGARHISSDQLRAISNVPWHRVQ